MKYISHLQDTIYDKKNKTFATLESNDLKLWKVDIFTGTKNDKLNTLDTVPISMINIDQDPLKGTMMFPNKLISNYFHA